MGEFPGWLACRAWLRREPLTGRWAMLKPDERDRALAFWIRAAESDDWTREQLRLLMRICMDADDIPSALQKWVNEDYDGRLPPLRRGPRTDHASDFRIMTAVEIRKLVFGETDHAARRAVSEELNAKHPQYDKVRGAHERGKRWPPGAWPNSK